MPSFRTLDQLDVAGRRVLLRLDLNVPMKDGRVADPTRIDRSAATVQALLDRDAKVVILSHFGRPDGKTVPAMSLQPIAEALGVSLGGRKVGFAADCIGPVAGKAVAALKPGEALLLENVRFHAGEEKNEPGFAAALAKLGDLYVNDAFSCAHRAHASTEALARLLPAAAGLLMQAELEHLAMALESPQRPVCAIVGGAKISTKLELLGNLVDRMDMLVIGGGMANTFLAAVGQEIGRSLAERDMAETARTILERAKAAGCDVVLPEDAVVAPALERDVATATVDLGAIPAGQMILDVGPKTVATILRRLESCRTLVWNGPLGAFETPPFDRATLEVATTVARLTREGRLVSVAGGGDTVAALAAAGVANALTYVSTAGGAFLEWLEGRTLPGVKALEEAAGR
ncbi:MAG: phosphoglycerate kinase [Dongiaceae bacterium]